MAWSADIRAHRAASTMNATPLDIINTEGAPQAIGPYSQAVRTGNLVFCSGQLPLDPETGIMVAGGIADQTRQVLKNLQAVLESADSSLDQVVQTTVYLQDLAQFTDMNQVYAEVFGRHKPARATVQVARLPKDALVEITVIATVD